MKKFSFIFFGTPDPAVQILEELKKQNLIPSLVVTNPDKAFGRKQILTPPPAKIWAEQNNVPFIQPEIIDEELAEILKQKNSEIFIVVAYGKILKKSILEIPSHGSINVHYSLLPKYRGASPVETQILNDDKEAGISLLLLDEELDHGPIIAQEKVHISPWPPTTRELRTECNRVAGILLADVLPKYLSGEIIPKEQDHSKATHVGKFKTEDGEVSLSGDPYKNYLKFQAFSNWLPVYFFADHNGKKIRVKITEAKFSEGKFCPTKVIPEGKKEMDYDSFKRGLK